MLLRQNRTIRLDRGLLTPIGVSETPMAQRQAINVPRPSSVESLHKLLAESMTHSNLRLNGILSIQDVAGGRR